MTCKTYLQTFHVILMRFTNHKITNHKITKGFCDNHQKILYNLLIYYIYYNIYNILLFILVISLLPFLFFLLWFCDFVICDFVTMYYEKHTGSGVLCVQSTPGQECCASYFDYPFATLQLATLQLANVHRRQIRQTPSKYVVL